jgi:hypothetical protein
VEEIIIEDGVHYFLQELVQKLYKEEYFGFEETAHKYVDKIYDFIYTELPKNTHKSTPKRLIKHGKYYTMYKAGKRTAWYVFFDKKDKRFYIEYITNNHVSKAAFLKGL